MSHRVYLQTHQMRTFRNSSELRSDLWDRIQLRMPRSRACARTRFIGDRQEPRASDSDRIPITQHRPDQAVCKRRRARLTEPWQGLLLRRTGFKRPAGKCPQRSRQMASQSWSQWRNLLDAELTTSARDSEPPIDSGTDARCDRRYRNAQQRWTLSSVEPRVVRDLRNEHKTGVLSTVATASAGTSTVLDQRFWPDL